MVKKLLLSLAFLFAPAVAFAQGGLTTPIVSSAEPLPNCTPATNPTQLQPIIWDTTAQVVKTCTGVNTWTAFGAVASVFGRTGAVVAVLGDYSFSQISGNLNLATQVTGLLANANLANPSVTINGQSCILGSTCTIPTGTVSNVTGTSNEIDVLTGTTTPVISIDPNLVLTNQTFSMSNPGTFSNTASSFPDETLINGCNPQTSFASVQNTAYLSSSGTFCMTGPTNWPGSSLNQVAGLFTVAKASGLGSGSGQARAVGLSSYGLITGNGTYGYGGNFVVQDAADSATGQILTGLEIDTQPQKVPSAYAFSGFGVEGLHLEIFNQSTTGTYGPAIRLTQGTANTFWGYGLDVDTGSICTTCMVLNVNPQGTATSGTNYSGYNLVRAYTNYWTGATSAFSAFSESQAVTASGTNPAWDELLTTHDGSGSFSGPVGQAHYFFYW